MAHSSPASASHPIEGAQWSTRLVQSARAALPEWAQTPPLQRARVFFQFKALLEAHAEELARLITHEHGKVLGDANATQGSVAASLAAAVAAFGRGAAMIRAHDVRETVEALAVAAAVERGRITA